MTFPELIQISLVFLLCNVFFILFGLTIWQYLSQSIKSTVLRYNYILIIGTSLLIGIGTFTTIMLFVGLIYKFNYLSVTSLFCLVLFFIVIQRNTLLTPFQRILKDFQRISLESVKKKLPAAFSHRWLVVIFDGLLYLSFIVAILAVITTLYLSALQFPFVSDELSYHLPQSQEIVSKQKIDPQFGGHYFYGSIPKLFEVLFALGILIHGLQLTHLFHLSVYLGFLLIVYGFSSQLFSHKTAILSILLILFIDEFRTNAVLAYIDAGTTSFEIGALLLFLLWIKCKEKSLLIATSFLIGFALASKYSAIFTMLFILGILLIQIPNTTKKTLTKLTDKRTFILLLIILTFTSGYWYIKNLLLYTNPTYPLFFGHKGVTDQDYSSLIQAIQEFGERDLKSFLKLPLKYFDLSNFTIFYSIVLLPLFFFVSKHRRIIIIMTIFVLIYLPYWFFLATHQTRFLIPALTVSSIVLAIALNHASKTLILLLILTGLLITIVANFFKPLSNESPLTVLERIKDYRLHLMYRQYGMGNIDKETSLQRFLGCQYSVINYLEENNLEGNVMDNWTVWQDISASFYAENNKFRNSAIDPAISIKEQLKSYNINYIYVKDLNKVTFKDKTDPIESEYYKKRITVENELIKKSDHIYQSIDCHLYKIRIDDL